MLAHRLCDAITKKLEQMEKGMESGELNSSDYERDAKSVAWRRWRQSAAMETNSAA